MGQSPVLEGTSGFPKVTSSILKVTFTSLKVTFTNVPMAGTNARAYAREAPNKKLQKNLQVSDILCIFAIEMMLNRTHPDRERDGGGHSRG